jgi:hypothetical protein
LQEEEEHYCQMSTLPLQWTKDSSSSSSTDLVEHIQKWLGQSLILLDLAGTQICDEISSLVLLQD